MWASVHPGKHAGHCRDRVSPIDFRLSFDGLHQPERLAFMTMGS